MVITNGSEHKINWNIKCENKNHANKIIKSSGIMTFMRGDKVFEEKGNLEYEHFNLPQLFAKKYG